MIGADDRRTRVFLVTILAAGLVLRLAAAVLLPEQNFPDAVLYREQARQLWQHFTFDDPYRMPLYQILMALTGPGWGSLALDVVLSTATIWLSFQLSLALFADAITALVTAFAMAVYPYFIFYAVVRNSPRHCLSRCFWLPMSAGIGDGFRQQRSAPFFRY